MAHNDLVIHSSKKVEFVIWTKNQNVSNSSLCSPVKLDLDKRGAWSELWWGEGVQSMGGNFLVQQGSHLSWKDLSFPSHFANHVFDILSFSFYKQILVSHDSSKCKQGLLMGWLIWEVNSLFQYFPLVNMLSPPSLSLVPALPYLQSGCSNGAMGGNI